MPAYSKSASSDPKTTGSSPPNSDLQSTVADQDSSSRAGKRKTKNAAKQSLSRTDNEDSLPPAEQMGTQNPSILNQLHGFPNKKNASLDALNDLNSTQKVSDQATPPIDVWSRSNAYGRSPPVDAIPGLSIRGSPTIEPGFSTRGHLNLRSPPVSPPLRKARPVSYGSGVPPLPSNPRISTSPYSYSTGAYGSPPALPHLPQKHFYAPHDIDLGLQSAPTQPRLQDPVVLRFSPVPGSRPETRDAALLALEGGLSVLSYTGDRLEHIGALHGIQGTIVDAKFLTWTSGHDPFAEFRPLIALTVHGVAQPEKEDQRPRDRANSSATEALHETRVVVYSLARASQMAELLRVPSQMSFHPGGQSATAVAANLTVDASGNFITITSGVSGELYIFTIRRGRDSPVFECLGKYWTTIQPQVQRRDSSHSRASDADVSPADIGRGPEMDDLPIVSLNGRWLAYCPASTPSRPSIGAALGDLVLHNKNSHISSGTAPSRPLLNCEVDSPDVDTFLSKVAKGFAQEAVRSAKWISDKGIQTWQTYWKKDSSSPGQPASSSSSPPIYSPLLGLVQFPPTHAGDTRSTAHEPELVTILDLKLLQETQGRKNVDSTPMTTFQPPGGCSFLSFMPTALGLMTANRKGDVQYIWDLMQIKYVKLPHPSSDLESGRVRQIARYERLSPSTIIDIAWDGCTGHRFALLTKNKTVHIFDLPNTAFQWPPLRIKKHRPASVPVDQSHVRPEPEPAPSGGFFASAMSIAGRTQPMLANLRGRAPSMGGGISGIGASGIGLASTTGIKGGRAVAAGLSKSLGAASETVTSIRHANQSRLHLKASARQGTLLWQRRDAKPVLTVLDSGAIKVYYVRMTKPRENRQRETVSVFDARKAVATKFPRTSDLMADFPIPELNTMSVGHEDNADDDESHLLGFWKFRANRDANQRMPHPLASAEIETNAPYQPFHSDPRVTLSVITDDQLPGTLGSDPWGQAQLQSHDGQSDDKWVFGTDIVHMERSTIPIPYPSTETSGSVIYRETKLAIVGEATDERSIQIADEGVSHIVSNTKKKKKKGRGQGLTLGENHDAIGGDPQTHVAYDPDFDLLEQDNHEDSR